jgi:hypothetical protein
MQGADENANPPERHPAGDQAVAQFADDLREIGRRAGAIHQPIDDVLKALGCHCHYKFQKVSRSLSENGWSLSQCVGGWRSER